MNINNNEDKQIETKYVPDEKNMIRKIMGSREIIMDNLEAVYFTEINLLLDTERQIIEFMPEIIDLTSNHLLKNELETHLHQTIIHREKITDLIEAMRETQLTHTCEGMRGILKEAKDKIKNNATQNVRDVLIIGIAKKIQQYKVTSYESVIEYAKILDEKEAETVLLIILHEDERTTKIFANLAIKDLMQNVVEGDKSSETEKTE